MIEKTLILTTVIPTACYFINAMLQYSQAEKWYALMWLGYAVANFAIMKGQGII